MLEHIVGSDGSLVCVATENMKYCTYDLPSKKMIICFANNKEKDKEDTYVIPVDESIYMNFVKRTSKPLTEEEIQLLSKSTLSLATAKKSFELFARYLRMRGLSTHDLFESKDAVLHDAFMYVCDPDSQSTRKSDDQSLYISHYILEAVYNSSSMSGDIVDRELQINPLNLYNRRTGNNRSCNGTAVLYCLVQGGTYFDIAFKVIPIIGVDCSMNGKAKSLETYLRNIEDINEVIYKNLLYVIYERARKYADTVSWLSCYSQGFIDQLKSIADDTDLDPNVAKQLDEVLQGCVSALEQNGYVFEKETVGCEWLKFLD